MAKVITLSRQFPSYHPKAGQETHFVENAWRSLFHKVILGIGNPIGLEVEYQSFLSENHIRPKHHTVRLGRRWKDGDMASLRVWSEKPYNSPQIKICQDVKLRVVDIVLDFKNGLIYRPMSDGSKKAISALELSINDGLTFQDFQDWFQVEKNQKKGIAVEAQILIWGDVKEY
jgi:hypothetical protein